MIPSPGSGQGRGGYGLGAHPGLCEGTVDQELLARNEYLAAENLSLLKIPSGHGIGIQMKAMVAEVQ